MAIIAVFNQKGGVGKTTTAVNLLAGFALAGHRPTGIDLDAQGHLSHVFGVRARNADDSVYGFFSRQRPLSEVATISSSGVAICPSHMELAKLDATLGKGFNVVTRLRHALRGPDAMPGPVVIDCCPLLNVMSLNAIFACDLLLIPVSADYLALQGAKEVEHSLNALEPVFRARLPRRYLVTRFDMRRRMSAEVVAEMRRTFREDEVLVTRIRENVKLAESPAVGLDVFRHAPDSRGARDYQSLVEELDGAGFLRASPRAPEGPRG